MPAKESSHDGDGLSVPAAAAGSTEDGAKKYSTSSICPNNRESAGRRHAIPVHSPSAPSMLPLSMQLMKPFWVMCCQECRANRGGEKKEILNGLMTFADTCAAKRNGTTDAADNSNNEASYQTTTLTSSPYLMSSSCSSSAEEASVETVLQEYISATKLYGCPTINAGVLTSFRFSLPTLRVSGSFHDGDMLALGEVLLKHCNGALSYIRRLDFSVASREGKLHGKTGFRSHGAFTLSKVLQISHHIEEVFVQKNRIGPYGASALFLAASNNPVLRTLIMRKCRIGERGAYAFAEYVCQSKVSALKEVDLSVNQIGFSGSIALETALNAREAEGRRIEVDLEGNLVFQEIMNGVTHGLGLLMCVVGTVLLSNRVKHSSTNHVISCAIYSTSLLVLYTSSTLYHSFFALQITRYIFEVLDHCAIYILIAGSYTPFLRITLQSKPIWSGCLLMFIWTCGICGVYVEAFHPHWIYKSKFSLAMYLGMGWSCLVCIPDLVKVLPPGALKLIILGGVGYTSGVPFFVRNNNLDHSIWHCFVLAGSIFHWICVYLLIAPMPSHF